MKGGKRKAPEDGFDEKEENGYESDQAVSGGSPRPSGFGMGFATAIPSPTRASTETPPPRYRDAPPPMRERAADVFSTNRQLNFSPVSSVGAERGSPVGSLSSQSSEPSSIYTPPPATRPLQAPPAPKRAFGGSVLKSSPYYKRTF